MTLNETLTALEEDLTDSSMQAWLNQLHSFELNIKGNKNDVDVMLKLKIKPETITIKSGDKVMNFIQDKLEELK